MLGSVASLTLVLQQAFAESLDLAEIGREVMQSWTEGLANAMRFRRDGGVAAERFIDVRYQDLLRDPIGTNHRIYSHSELPFTPDAERRMRSHLAAYPKNRHGQHQYDLESFGLDGASVERRFQAYREFFAIEPETA